MKPALLFETRPLTLDKSILLPPPTNPQFSGNRNSLPLCRQNNIFVIGSWAKRSQTLPNALCIFMCSYVEQQRWFRIRVFCRFDYFPYQIKLERKQHTTNLHNFNLKTIFPSMHFFFVGNGIHVRNYNNGEGTLKICGGLVCLRDAPDSSRKFTGPAHDRLRKKSKNCFERLRKKGAPIFFFFRFRRTVDTVCFFYFFWVFFFQACVPGHNKSG